MNNNISLKIVVAETSVIVRSGLAAVLKRIPNLNAHPIEVSSPEALQNYIHLHTPDIVIVNPTFGGWFDLPSFTHVIELLAKGDWIDEPNNLLITGGAGAGKTYVACALCVTALHQMRTVKYIRANYLLQESAHAHSEDNYYEYSNKMAGYDLLVIDDFGLMDLNLDKCRDLFEIIEARDCRKSTVIISQMPVANWYQLFGDNTYADACLSRMTSKAYRLDFPGRDRRVESK